MRWRWARTPASPRRPHTQQLITRGMVGGPDPLCPAAWQPHWQQSRRWRLPRLPSAIPFGSDAADAAVRRGADDWWVWHLAVRPADGRLQDGPWQERRARTKVTSGSQGFVAGHQGKRCYPGPFSVIRTQEPVTMRAGDWISLAGLVVSVIGFSVVIRELIRIAHASETSQAGDQLNLREADPFTGGLSS